MRVDHAHVSSSHRVHHLLPKDVTFSQSTQAHPTHSIGAVAASIMPVAGHVTSSIRDVMAHRQCTQADMPVPAGPAPQSTYFAALPAMAAYRALCASKAATAAAVGQAKKGHITGCLMLCMVLIALC